MKNEIYDRVESTVKYWWIPLLVGVLSVVLGIWCLATPLTTFMALTILFIVAFLIKGIFEIAFALSNRDVQNWGWSLTIGILDLILAIVLIANSGLAAVVLVYYIIFWLIFQCCWGIGMSVELSKYEGSGWGWFLALAVIGLIFSSILLFRPLVAGFFASFMFASSFIIYGVFRIAFSFKLKSIKNYMK